MTAGLAGLWTNIQACLSEIPLGNTTSNDWTAKTLAVCLATPFSNRLKRQSNFLEHNLKLTVGIQ